LKKLGAVSSSSPATPQAHGPTGANASDSDRAQSSATTEAVPTSASTGSARAAVTRGGDYLGFPEKFNRYYTDAAWKPSKIVYVSSKGGGDGSSREAPATVAEAVSASSPGTEIYFLRGDYQGCFDFSKETGGTYDDPVLLYGERNEEGTIGVRIKCCNGGQACFNFEDSDYVAVDGFELVRGKYGVRAVGRGYAASEHSRGIAVMNCVGHDQDKDPFFTGQSDWDVWQNNVAYGAKKDDGHGIYLSNGSDWNIVRFNETYENMSSDFQINADPASTCDGEGIADDDARCDAYAGEGEGGQGASDYFLVEGNYFHHGLWNGPNFTSVRRSVVRNNIFGPQARHNVTFWQETENPKLGSSDNKILHNLFITTERHGVKFENNSTRNEFANNVIIGVKADGGSVTANPDALLMEVDDTVGDNQYRANLYVSGTIEGRTPNDEETALKEFSTGWFTNFPAEVNHDANDFTPTAEAPFLGMGTLSADAPTDRNGTVREGKVDLGPIEGP
jgi:hypothetical protein